MKQKLSNGRFCSSTAGTLGLHFWRADVYRLLALAFDFPSLPVSGAVKQFADDLAECPFGGEEFRSHFRGLSGAVAAHQGEREGLYHQLFTTQVACPPCEGAYQLVERGPILGDVTAFYTAFHIKAVGGEGPPDSIKMELGFMSYLCLKRAQALQNNLSEALSITAQAEKKFLKNHLGRWGHLMAGRLLAATEDPYYSSLAHLLSLWMDKECRLTGAKPNPLPTPLPAVHEEGPIACA